LHFYVTFRLASRLRLLTEKGQGKNAKKAKAKKPKKLANRQDDAPTEKKEKGETRKVFVFS